MATDTTNQRLAEMLSGRPPQNTSVKTINFDELEIPEYKDHFAILIDDLFSESECEALLESARGSAPEGWEQAMVNVGMGFQEMRTDVRLCDRILWDDHEIAGRILNRVKVHLPTDIVTLKNMPLVTGKGPVKRKETWQISRLNERLRFLKYTKGNYFRIHRDGTYVTPDQKEMSFLTVHLYLNGNEALPAAQRETERGQDEPLVGGATRFFSGDMEKFWDVNPRTGSVLVFQHRNLLHSGEEVEQGTKYTMRSDILYKKA